MTLINFLRIQLSTLSSPPLDWIIDPNPPIHANIPPEINIDINNIEIYLFLIAGTIPKTIPKQAPENPPIINPDFITAQLVDRDIYVLIIERSVGDMFGMCRFLQGTFWTNYLYSQSISIYLMLFDI